MRTDPRIELLREAPKAIAHLKAQFERKRLGLMFGSGIGRDLKFPDWAQLVDRMARRKEIRGVAIMRRFRSQGTRQNPTVRSLASVTQMLFSHFRLNQLAKNGWTTPLTFIQEQTIKSAWLKILHSELYRDQDLATQHKRIEKHPYLTGFQNIIKKTKLTVNYNFDDSLEQMLLRARSKEEQNRTRGYEATDHPSLQFQENFGVIYHPNGYLPSVFNDGPSEKVIFSDDAFQDQVISAANGKYLHLTNHLFSNTCLLIGLSLEDATLQSLLRQNATANPGNVHYLVQFVSKANARDLDQENATFRLNFESFNIYTLFLDQAGIKALSELIEMDETTFQVKCASEWPKFIYYLVGSVGAGKSTAARNFRNLYTYDEWIDPRKQSLAKPDDELTSSERVQVDRWVAEQFRKKNIALARRHYGIHLVDRSPLDPLTFGKPSVRPRKARNLLKRVTNQGTLPIADGHIIYLDSSIEDIEVRNTLKHKYWGAPKYLELMDQIFSVYSLMPRSVICTRGRDAAEVAAEIAKVIFTEDYVPVDINSELRRVAGAAGA